MQVKEESADRRSRISAVCEKVAPPATRTIGRIGQKCLQQMARMVDRQSALVKYAAEGNGGALRIIVARRLAAQQDGVERLQARHFCFAAQSPVVSDVVGEPREAIECGDDRTMGGGDEPRTDRKVLARRGLARGCGRRRGGGSVHIHLAVGAVGLRSYRG